VVLLTAGLLATHAAAQSRTLVGQSVADHALRSQDRDPHVFYDLSIFAVDEARPRIFRPHDLVQIVVQERSESSSSQELNTNKEFTLDGSVNAFPRLSLADIAQLQLMAGRTTGLPAVDVELTKDFQGEGDYSSENQFTTRITAEVVEVLPNGNMVVEARTSVRSDDEVSTITVTGICRGEDVTTANTILSNQIHDLRVVKKNEGRLPEASRKGLVTQFFDFLFAF
jgi:flagellar L-ring protein precursor FlgH